MNKTLLSLFLWTVSIALCFGQSGTNLNRATRFAVLASTEVTISGQTTVAGDLGISPGNKIEGTGGLNITGSKELGTPTAALAMTDARAAYNALWMSPSPVSLTTPLGNNSTIVPGIYKVSGNTSLGGSLTLDAQGNTGAEFIFIIDGSLSAEASTQILLVNGAQSQNVYWTVSGSADIIRGSSFYGNVLANGNITLGRLVGLTDRMFSLEGAVNLNSNSLALATCPATPGAITGPAALCRDNDFRATATYSVAEVAGATTYNWTLSTGWTITAGEGTNSITVATSASAVSGNITVAAVNSSCTSQPSTIAVTLKDTPEDKVITGESTVCVSTTPIRYSITAPAEGETYAGWQAEGDISIVSSTATTADVVVSGSGRLVLIAVNECGSRNFYKNITTNTPPMPGAITGSTVLCRDNDFRATATYSVAAVAGATTYNWTLPTGWIITAGAGTRTITASTSASAVSGNITVTAGNGDCVSPASTLAVMLKDTPAPRTISGDATACVSTTPVTYSVPVIEGEEYTWEAEGAITIVGNPHFGSQVSVIISGPGRLTSIAINECGSNNSYLNITPTTKLTAPASITVNTTSTSCAPQQTLTLTAAAVAGADSYNWTLPTGWVITTGEGTNTITVTASTSGTVSVSAVNKCGAGAAATKDVTVMPATPPMPGAITGSTVLCRDNDFRATATYSVAAVAGATTYNWTLPTGWIITAGAGTRTITASTSASAVSGNITVTAGNGDCVSPASTLAVMLKDTPAPRTISGDATACVSTTPVTYSVPVIEGEEYTWEAEGAITIVGNPHFGSQVSVIISGPGRLTSIAVNECGSNNSYLNITPTTKLTAPASITVNTTSTSCAPQQTLTLTAAAVAGADSYNWTLPTGWVITTGEGTNTITVTASTSGTVSVSAVNKCGAGAAATKDVTVMPATPPMPGAITGSTVLCRDNDFRATATYSVAAVAGATTYNWTLPTGWIITAGAGTRTITASTSASAVSGNITVTAGNGDCVSPASTLAVMLKDTPAPRTISGDATACVSTTPVTYSVPVIEGEEYTWEAEGAITIVGNPHFGSQVSVIISGPGRLTSIAVNECGSNNSYLNITPTTKLTAPASITVNTTSTSCAPQQTLTLTAAAVAGADSYNWTLPTGWVITTGEGTNTITVTASTSGTVSVSAVNKCGAGAAATKDVTVMPATPPMPGAITGSTVLCRDNDFRATATYSVAAVAGATTYNWTLPTGWIITAGAGTRTITASTSASAVSGNITVTAGNGDCVSPASTLAVMLKDTPAPRTISGDATACVSTTPVTYSVPVIEGEEYTWEAEGAITIVGNPHFGSQVSVIISGPGRLTSIAVNECGSNNSYLNITPTTKLTAPASITVNTTSTSCAPQQTLTLTAAAVAGADSYNWTLPTGWVITTGEGTNTITVTASTSGTVSVSAVNKCGAGAAATKDVTVMPATPPMPGAITGSTVLCRDNDFRATATYSVAAVAGATTYNWTLPTGWIITAGAGTRTITASTSASAVSGNITVTAGNGDCVSPASTLAVMLKDTPAPRTISGDATACVSTTPVTYSVPVIEGEEYTWEAEGAITIVGNPHFGSQVSVIISGPGRLTSIAINECGSNNSYLNITPTTKLTAPASITSSATGAICQGQEVTLTAAGVTGATSYNWTVPTGWTVVSTDRTTSTLVVIPSATGTVSVSAVNKCGASAAATREVTVNPLPTPGAITGPAEVCANTTGVVFSVAEVAGATSYNWTLPTGWTITAGAGTRSITVTTNNTGGDVKVGVASACATTPVQSAPKTVTISTPPAAVAAILDNSTLCEGLSFSVAAVPGATTYNWTVPTGFTITAGQGTTSIKVKRDNNSATGNVTVTPGNASTCPGNATNLAIDTEILDGGLVFPKAFSPNNDGINDTWEIKNLLKYSENEVVIFSRYGNELFKTKNYKNNWNGNGLEKGTYFYKVTVKMCDGVTKQFTGYTTIFR